MRGLRKGIIGLLLSFSLFLYGCAPLVIAGAGAATGVATYAYIKGVLKVEYPRAYERVWRATVAALKDCQIKIEETKKDHISGKIKGKRADGTPVTVKVINKASNVTVVKIRVGLFGNKNASLIIKEAIDRRLGLRK